MIGVFFGNDGYAERHPAVLGLARLVCVDMVGFGLFFRDGLRHVESI